MDDPAARLRDLPQLHRLLDDEQVRALIASFSRLLVAATLRDVLDEARQSALLRGIAPPRADELVARAAERLAAQAQPVLRGAINATGIILHTNLGRAPLAAEALAAVAAVAGGYCNLEFDLAAGERGARTQGIEPLLRELTGAEAGVAVNNNAAAVLLALSALAADGEVIVSRGELVEIGGGFRVPDIIRQGGARLVEVGTTNRTRLDDYRAAITSQTRVLLKVHRSNFRITGFTAEAGMADLAGLAREHGLALVEDLGSGALGTLPGMAEPTVRDSVAAGADLVAFSGDKLLGGPQAGLLVGRAAILAPLRRHPLLRALRLDKLTLAALEATLRLHRDPAQAAQRVPALRMLGQGEAVLQARAERLCARLQGERLQGVEARIDASTGYAGGGTLPDQAIASRAVSLTVAGQSAGALAEALRRHHPAVVSRLAGQRLVLDMLAVTDEQVDEIAQAIVQATAGAAA